jgi:hypothetical protein
VTFGHCEAQTQRANPFPSWATERKERDDRARVPGPVSTTTPETHGPCSGPPVAKSLVYGLGPGSSWGDRASSPTRFNTYSRGSTHLGAARPGPGFFLSFGSLKPGCWDLGPGLVETQDLGLETEGTILKVTWVLGPRQTVRRPGRPVPALRHGRNEFIYMIYDLCC